MNIKKIKKTKEIDSWIKINQKEASFKRDVFTAETIFLTETNDGYLNKMELHHILCYENIEIIAGLRLLLKCMTEERIFDTTPCAELDPKDNQYKYRIYESNHGKTVYYDVLAIDGMSYLISGYLEGLYSINVDFDELIEFATNKPCD